MQQLPGYSPDPGYDIGNDPSDNDTLQQPWLMTLDDS